MLLFILALAFIGSAQGVGWENGDTWSTLYPYYWDYDDSAGYGPSNWGGSYSGCALTGTSYATYTSPYGIQKSSSGATAITGVDILNGDSNNAQSVIYMQNWRNTIKTSFSDTSPWTIKIADDASNVLSKASVPTAKDLKLSHWEWRWGSSKYDGAEHIVVTDAYSTPLVIELQMFFYDSSQITSSTGMAAFKAATELSNVNTATAATNGIVVISVPFYAKSGGYNSYIQTLLPYFGTVRANNAKAKANQKYGLPTSKVSSSKTFDLTKLLPSSGASYNTYYYQGCLTFPPCSQAAHFVTQTYSEMSLGQAATIRVGVYNSRTKRMKYNFRGSQYSAKTLYKVSA